MDKERQIRFLYPPFFIIFSMLIALYFDNTQSIETILPVWGNELGSYEIISIIIGGGIITLVLGFVIGTLTINMLRFCFWIFTRGNHEISLSDDSYIKIYEKLGCKTPSSEDNMYAGATFDHAIIPEKIHQWTIRRWNAFNISSNSIVALIISIFIIWHLKIDMSYQWILFMIGAISLFFINARIAWKQTMRMLNFQSQCNY